MITVAMAAVRGGVDGGEEGGIGRRPVNNKGRGGGTQLNLGEVEFVEVGIHVLQRFLRAPPHPPPPPHAPESTLGHADPPAARRRGICIVLLRQWYRDPSIIIIIK